MIRVSEKRQIQILTAVVLILFAVLVVYTAFFATPIKLYEVTAEHLGVSSDAAKHSATKADASELYASDPNSTETEASKININTASVLDLTKLDGIGETTARKIIAYREEMGEFASIEEIMEVDGIGEKKFEAMREKISVTDD